MAAGFAHAANPFRRMQMTRLRLIPAVLLAAGLLAAPLPSAQEEPEIEEPDIVEPELTAEPEPAEARPFRPAVLDGAPLRTTLDFDRWAEMTYRERQTFVEGAVLTLASVSNRMKTDLTGDARIPPENLSAVVRFIQSHHPKLPPESYMREMDRIYLTAEGQNLSIIECFQAAFARLNGR
jgi:hypothetical protein